MDSPEKSFSLFLMIWAGQFLSKIGSGISASALGVYLLQETGSASAYSFLLTAAFLPSVLLAPFIAAFLLTRFSIVIVLGADVASFLLAALSVILIRKRMAGPKEESTGKTFRKSFTEGIRYLAGNDTVRCLLWLTTGVTFLTGFLQSLFVPIVLSFTDIVTLGTVQSVSAFGMLAGSLMVGVYGRSDASRQVLSFSLAAAGLFCTLIGATHHILVITGTAFCFFFALPFVNSSLEVLFRRNIDNEMQGRTWSLISLISQSGMLIALGSAGPLADHLFNPLLTETGRLSETVGSIIGTGAYRGSGLMVMIAGLFLLTYALWTAKAETDPKGVVDLSV